MNHGRLQWFEMALRWDNFDGFPLNILIQILLRSNCYRSLFLEANLASATSDKNFICSKVKLRFNYRNGFFMFIQILLTLSLLIFSSSQL